jgi:hypothetical protein
MTRKVAHGLQDGMLAWYQSQAALSDSAVEKKIEKEPFDFRWHAAEHSREAAKKATLKRTS